MCIGILSRHQSGTKELHALPHVGYPPNSFVPHPLQRTRAFKIDLLACACFSCNSFFPENIEAKLTDDQKLSCEGELSAAECFESLKTMEMGKSPGSDGLPAEFYKVFWNDVSTHLLASLIHLFPKAISPFHNEGV